MDPQNNKFLPRETSLSTQDTLHLAGHLQHSPHSQQHHRHHQHQHQRGEQGADDEEELFQQLCHSLLREDAGGGVGGPLFNAWQSSSSSSASHSDGSAGAMDAAAGDAPSTLLSPVMQMKEGSPPPPNPNLSPATSHKPKHKPKQKAEEGSAAKKSQRMVRMSLTEAEEALQGLTQRFSRAQAENIRLRNLDKTLTAGLQQADFQHHLSEVISYSPRNPLLLPSTTSQVSFSELPPASTWDASWVSRIKQLGPHDLLMLNRQWTQQSAMLLPQAMAYPGSAADKRLEWLHDRHTDLTRAVVTMSPGVWLESQQYDMETLMPIHTPTAEWMRDVLRRGIRPEALSNLVSCANEYHAATGALHAEYCQLLERYNSLAAAANMQPLKLEGADVAGSSRTLGPRFSLDSHHQHTSLLRLDGSPQYVHALEQMDQVAKMLQANTSRHKAALVKYFSTFYCYYHPKRVNFALMTYPIFSTAVNFLPGLLLLDDAASPSPQVQAQPQPSATPLVPPPAPAAGTRRGR